NPRAPPETRRGGSRRRGTRGPPPPGIRYRRLLRLLLRLEAVAHELLAIVALQVLAGRLLVAGLHLLRLAMAMTAASLIRRLLRLRSILAVAAGVALQAMAHEVAARLAGQLLLGGVVAALGHALCLRRVELLLVGGRGDPGGQENGHERSQKCVHGALLDI